MRWNTIEMGAERTREWFALFPVWINYETRWLERVRVLERWHGVWISVKFIDKE